MDLWEFLLWLIVRHTADVAFAAAIGVDLIYTKGLSDIILIDKIRYPYDRCAEYVHRK